MQRKSILNKIICLNLAMTLIVTILFVTSSRLYATQLTNERYNQAYTTLSKLNKDFQIEMHRLDALLTMCVQDSSIVFCISDKLDSEFFLTNAQEASSKLSLIRQSLPYAKTVFLFTRDSQKVVRDNGSIYTEENFIKIVLNKAQNVSITDISTFPDGLYRYNDTYALYVKNLYRHGYVAVQIDLNEFANINKTLSKNFLGYVIQNNGTQIIENSELSLTDMELDQALNNDFITLSDTKYYCASSPMNVVPYTGLVLINNDSLMQPLNYMKAVMLITFSILLASSFILMLLNYKIYLPLKKITSQFSDSTENEIAIIEKQVHELLFEINTLKENSLSSDIVPEKIALHYLISGGAQLSTSTLDMLEKKYPYYMLIVLTIQTGAGTDDLLFTSSLEKEFSAHFSVKFIGITKYKFAVIARPEDKEEILAYLNLLVDESGQALQLFAGIREYCVDIKELYTEYKLAENCLLSSSVKNGQSFSYSEVTSLPQNAHLSQDMRQRIFEYARNNALPQLTKELDQLFYPDQGCTLASFRSYYHEVLSIFEKACMAFKNISPNFSHEMELYNTDYMYQTLNTLIQELFFSQQRQSPDMKQRMEKYISEHLSEPLTLDTVADAFSITPVYLSSWFKKNMNTNFLSYISNARMEHAKELLCDPNPPKIYEIALAVGIENPATFIRQFKKHTGITPSQYQKNLNINTEMDV